MLASAQKSAPTCVATDTLRCARSGFRQNSPPGRLTFTDVITRSLPLLFSLALIANAVSAQVPNQYVTTQDDLPCVRQTLSLRVHVIDDLDARPQDFDSLGFEGMVRRTNEWFAPICLGFEACEYLREDNFRYASFEQEDGEEAADLFGDPNRIDIYLTVRDSNLRCGLATPTGVEADSAAFVMVVGDCIDSTSKALAHELGHYFGLLNTNEAAETTEELVAGDNCETAGDLICDTPADPFDEESSVGYVDPEDPCRFTFRGRDANGQFYVPHTGNVMSRYEDICACGFTHEQLSVMAANYLEFRRGLY